VKTRQELEEHFAGAPPELIEYASQLQEEVCQQTEQLAQQEQELKRQQQLLEEQLAIRQRLLLEKETQLAALQQEAVRHEQELRRQQQLLEQARAHIAELKRQLFGPKADKLSPEQEEQLRQVAGDLQEHAQRPPPVSQDVLEPDLPPKDKEKLKRPPRQRRHPLPTVQLEVQRVVLEPDNKVCGICQKPGRKIGEEVTTEYEYVAAKLICKETVRPKYAHSCPCAPEAVSIAVLPSRLVPQSKLGLGLAVYILLSRFDDHIAYYTLERIFRERHGVIIARQQMVQWVEKIAFLLLAIYHGIWEELQATGYLQVDETPVKVLDPEVKGKAATGYLWFYSHPTGDVFLEFCTGRGREGPEKRLADFQGTIQTDAYAVYDSLRRQRPAELKRLGCLAHIRRKWYTAAEESCAQAIWFIGQIRQLYLIEDETRDLSDPERKAIRRQKAPALWRAMKRRALELRANPRLLPQSSLGKAVHYFLNEYTAAVGYLRDGQFQIDNNLVENDVRPSVVGRKRWLFIGHPDAGWRSAVIYTLIQSCRRRGINPQDYLTDVLARLPAMKNHEVKELLPSRWKLRSLAQPFLP
jgi:transposase